MSLKSRYNAIRNVYEIGYYIGTRFIVLVEQKAI